MTLYTQLGVLYLQLVIRMWLIPPNTLTGVTLPAFLVTINWISLSWQPNVRSTKDRIELGAGF